MDPAEPPSSIVGHRRSSSRFHRAMRTPQFPLEREHRALQYSGILADRGNIRRYTRLSSRLATRFSVLDFERQASPVPGTDQLHILLVSLGYPDPAATTCSHVTLCRSGFRGYRNPRGNFVAVLRNSNSAHIPPFGSSNEKIALAPRNDMVLGSL